MSNISRQGPGISSEIERTAEGSCKQDEPCRQGPGISSEIEIDTQLMENPEIRGVARGLASRLRLKSRIYNFLMRCIIRRQGPGISSEIEIKVMHKFSTCYAQSRQGPGISSEIDM